MKHSVLLKNKLKIGFRLFPYMLLISLVLLLALISFRSVVVDLMSSEGTAPSRKKMVLAVSGDYENSILSSAVAAISLMDYSKYSFDIKCMKAAEAKRRLEKGEITAWVDVPKGFAEAFDNGQEPKKLIYTYSDKASNLGKMLTYDVLATASGYITIAHSTIYNFIDYYDEKGQYSQSVVDRLMEEEIFAIISREDAFDIRRVQKESDDNLATSIFCGLLVLFFMLMGTIATQAFGERNLSVEKRLNINGVGAVSQSLVDFLVLFLVEEVLVLGDGLLLLLINRITGLLENSEVAGDIVLRLAFFSIPLVFFMASLQLLIYELMGSGIGGVMTNFFAAVFIGFLSGCLYPLSFFPDTLQRIANATPIGMSVKHLYNVFTDNVNNRTVIFILLYAFLFLAISVFVRKKKLYDGH